MTQPSPEDGINSSRVHTDTSRTTSPHPRYPHAYSRGVSIRPPASGTTRDRILLVLSLPVTVKYTGRYQVFLWSDAPICMSLTYIDMYRPWLGRCNCAYETCLRVCLFVVRLSVVCLLLVCLLWILVFWCATPFVVTGSG